VEQDDADASSMSLVEGADESAAISGGGVGDQQRRRAEGVAGLLQGDLADELERDSCGGERGEEGDADGRDDDAEGEGWTAAGAG
jgi:hypothetical protein